jgi:hypothetical protein
MNPTEKMEMQVEELQDGGATVVLPENEVSPQADDVEVNQSDTLVNKDPVDDDDDHLEGRSQDRNISDEDREKIREARREERKLKKQIHRGKVRESNYLINALKKQNSELAERLARVEQKTSGAELARVDKAIEDAGVQVEYAKMKMTEAVRTGDGDAMGRAQELWYESKRKLESLNNLKEQAVKQTSQPQRQNIQVPDPMVQRHAADWMERNPWYDPNGNNEESEIAQVIDKKLTAEGYDPTSEDYWDELDDRLRKYLPNVQNSSYNPSTTVRSQRPRSVMTSSGRDTQATTKANQFVVSPDRVAAMKEAGVWENQELRMKMIKKYAEYDRQAKQNRT